MENSQLNKVKDVNVSKPGAFLHLKKVVPHAKYIGNSAGQLLLEYTPAGFGNFFAEVGIGLTFPMNRERNFIRTP
jgi:hypothetical protein